MAQLDQSSLQTALAAAFDDPDLQCYAIVDSAQDSALLAMLTTGAQPLAMRSACLLKAARDSEEIEAVSPHLVVLAPLAADTEQWPVLLQDCARAQASMTLLASVLDFDTMLAHLEGFTEIVLPDGTDMIFALWDPAVLGTLTGQASDTTLHVPGPVLAPSQRARLLDGIAAWWYWDRDGNAQQVQPDSVQPDPSPLPLKLRQFQVDMLVEAGVPDQLLATVQENQPTLLWDIPPAQHYRRMERHLLEARKLQLFGMRDIVNYTCAALIYGSQMQDEAAIVALLAQVRAGDIDLDAALERFPMTRKEAAGQPRQQPSTALGTWRSWRSAGWCLPCWVLVCWRRLQHVESSTGECVME